jgi:hypothetical protein
MVEAHPSVSDLQAIAVAYERVDLHLQSLRDAEDGSSEDPSPESVDREQRLNDQAYFVLAWGQLEADIEEACREAIREGQSHEDWRHRRAWSLYNPEDRRLSGLTFQNRLTLVIEKGSDDWKRTMELYNVRNQIAHGALLSGGIDMASVIRDFFRIQSSLARV